MVIKSKKQYDFEKTGVPLLIVHENVFLDNVMDLE